MTDLRIGPNSPLAKPTAHELLRKVAHEFEGVFLAQLFREMRASVQHASGDSDPGREMFSGLFDESVAMEAARRSTNGLGEALYRQLAGRLDQVKEPQESK